MLQEQSGGFGTFLSLAHNAASPEATRKSYDLIARYVMPRFQHSNANRAACSGASCAFTQRARATRRSCWQTASTTPMRR